MSHVREHCDLPRRRLHRWYHRLWICTCGQGWTVRGYGSMDGTIWGWEKWPDESE